MRSRSWTNGFHLLEPKYRAIPIPLCPTRPARNGMQIARDTRVKAAGVSETALDGPLVIGEGLWIVWRVRIRDCSCGAVQGLRVWSATHDIG